MILRGGLFACAVVALSACVGGPERHESVQPVSNRFDTLALPAMRTFSAAAGVPSLRSNAEIAQDFLDLSFRLETGRSIPAFSRFVGPMTVRMIGQVPDSAQTDMMDLLRRLQLEAGLPIRLTNDADAAISIEFLPRARMQFRAQDAACFVVPRVSSWAQYRRASGADLDWATYTARERVAVFIPSDTSHQEIRDCMHEEMAQALGPLNDLYRLPDSIFNDDNIHGVLTGFDMALLRATYSDDLQAGMSEAAVAAALPVLLARVNPAGNHPGVVTRQTPRAFGDAIARALGRNANETGRARAAEEALSIAQSQGWQDHRTGFAWLTFGRVQGRGKAEAAHAAFANAAAIFHARNLPLHAANADLQLAMFDLADGNWQDAINLTEQSIPAARAGQNAALMASLMMVKAAALEKTGHQSEANTLRLDSLGWARYGMVSDAAVRRHLALIDDLANQAGKPKP